MKFRRENVGNCGAGALNNCRYEQTRDVAAGQVLSLYVVVVTKLGSERENTTSQWVGGLGCFLCGVCVGFWGELRHVPSEPRPPGHCGLMAL